MDDWQLLRDYVERRSETAFELLVKRHVDMVYATALRHLRDSHLAKDACQAVFILLARKAGSLKPPVILAGWLYRTASHVASRALREKLRRQRREEEASTMNFNDPAQELWGKLEPHLDSAISALNAADRHVVVLHFLQQRSFRDVAASLGVSEDAAKKRTNRALDKLRTHLTARGITVASAVLGTALTTGTAQAAPTLVVAAAISAGALGAPATATALTLAGQVAREWLFAKLKWAGAIAGAGALVLLVATHGLPGTPAPAGAAANSNVPTNNAGIPAVAQDEPAPASPVAPPLNPRAMRVKVVSSADGSPLLGAKARVVFYGPKGSVENATAGANGVIEIARPDRTYAGMAYWIAAPGHVPKCLLWKQVEENFLPADYEVRLDPGVRVYGRVVDESGQPVAGATLRFGEEGMKSNARDYVDYRYPSFVPTSNANGDWSADFLRPRAGTEGIGGYVEHPDYAETAFSFPLAITGASNVTVVIKQGAPVAGLVVGAGGESVPEALVTVDWQYNSCRNEIKTKTDATGRFFLAHVTPSHFLLKTSAHGYQTLEQWYELSQDGLDVTATLSSKKVAGSSLLRGRVVDEAGSPISGIYVSLSDGQRAMEGANWSVQTDDGGRFAWNQAPEGTVQLSFSSPYYKQKDIGLTSGDTDHLVAMTTRKTAEAHCIVTDKASGLAIPRFKVLLGTRDTTWRYAWDDVKFAGEGTNGLFTLVRHLDQRPYSGKDSKTIVRIEADGYEPETVGLTNTTVGVLEIKVELDPELNLEGVVLTPSGEPASRAQVALTGANLRMSLNAPARFMVLDVGHEHTTTARSDGSFNISARKGAERMLIVHDAGCALLPLDQFAGGTIQLQPWGRVTGVLFIGRQVAADQNIQISSGAGLPDSISCSFNVKTDAKGGFTFDKVPPGKMCVTRYVFSPFSFDGTGCATKTQQQTVEVKSGETTQVTLGGRGVCVKGKLVLETIRADAVLELAAQNLRLASGKPDPESLPNGYGFFCQPDGSFIIEDVLPGAYMLEAQVEAVENRNQLQAYLTAFRVGERTVEVVIPEGQGEFDLGNIVVPVKSDPLSASDR